MEVTASATPIQSPLSPSAELVIDRRDTIESLNPAAEALFGYPAAELRGRSISALILPRPGQPSESDTAVPDLAPNGHLILGRHRSGAAFPLFASSQSAQDGAPIRLERPAARRTDAGTVHPDDPGMTRRHLLILNALLRPAANGARLRTQLEYALDLILSLPTMPAEKAGSILLLDADGRLTLRVARERHRPARADTRGLLATFEPSLYVPRSFVVNHIPVGPPIGGMVMAGNALPQYQLPGVPLVGRGLVRNVDKNNLAPRVGLAWSPLASGRLVFRTGGGLFHSRPTFNYASLTATVQPSYVLGRRTAPPFSDPYFAAPATEQFPTFVPGVNLTGTFFDRGLCTPVIYQYNASMQYEAVKNLPRSGS